MKEVMDDTQKAAYVQAQATAALIEALGMMSDNMQRQQHGYSIAYDSYAFVDVIQRYGLDHNAVITLFHGK